MNINYFYNILLNEINNNFNECVLYVLFILSMIKIYINNFPKLKYNSLTPIFNDIKKNLDTGDIIFFCCHDNIGKIIKKISNGFYSHCGLIIRRKKKLYVLECDMNHQYDYLTKKKFKQGAHLVKLDEKIKDYEGNVFAYRKLLGNKINKKLLNKIFKKSKKILFDNNTLNWYSAHLKSYTWSNLFLSEKYMFCSQYVAFVLQELGIIKKEYPTNFYSMTDFTCDLDYINNYYYGKCIVFRTIKN